MSTEKQPWEIEAMTLYGTEGCTIEEISRCIQRACEAYATELKAENLRLSKELNASSLIGRLHELQLERDRLAKQLKEAFEQFKTQLRETERLTAQVAQLRSALQSIARAELLSSDEPFQVWDRLTEVARQALAATTAPAIVPALRSICCGAEPKGETNTRASGNVCGVCSRCDRQCLFEVARGLPFADGQPSVPASDAELLALALELALDCAYWKGAGSDYMVQSPHKALAAFRSKHPKP